jgi:hypothetical protein
MSKHVNMTGHYKVAGRDRQGEGILQASQKGAYAQQRHEAQLQAIESQAGPPAWETTPPNLEIAERPAPRTRRKTAKTRSSKKPLSAKRTRKATPKKKVGRVAVKQARRPAAASKGSGRTRRARS